MILNLTQHKATPEQIKEGVVDLSDAARTDLAALLTFAELPSPQSVAVRAAQVAAFAQALAAGTTVMIGGAPFFMAPLEAALAAAGFFPVYAFSTRDSVEQTMPDGTVRKVAVFRHAGFVPAWCAP
jgi:hypothetical protein